jgi:hypothetical protein
MSKCTITQQLTVKTIFNLSSSYAEVVLFMLIESFRFSPSKQEIIWEMNGITSPNVKGGDGKFPLMPLLVERI